MEQSHDGLAGKVDARGAAGTVPPTCAILAPLTTSVVLSRTRPSPTMMRAPFVGGDALCARLTGDAGKDTESNGCRQSGYVHRCIGTSLVNWTSGPSSSRDARESLAR